MEKVNEQVFYKKAVRINFAIFTEKRLCWSLFLSKNADLQLWNFIKNKCFLVNITKFLRTPVLKIICERLLERFATRANNITSDIESEEDIFSKTKQKSHSKYQLDEKDLPFHDALDHFVFLCFSNACLRLRLSCIIKDNSSEGI